MKRTVTVILDILLMVCFSILILLLCNGMDQKEKDIGKKQNSNYSPDVSYSSDDLPENPIDFAKLQEQNADVCAWITIPNTKVDYPILQSADDEEEDYYLHRDIEGNYAFEGCIYIQKLNKKDFSDPVTVAYGHSMLNKTMFGSLHSFKNTEFFKDNSRIMVYKPGHILVYRIFSAYAYDDRLILDYFDFQDKDVFESYLKDATNPSVFGGNHADINVTTNDKVLILSTCTGNDAERFLVQAVLEKDQPTKE